MLLEFEVSRALPPVLFPMKYMLPPEIVIIELPAVLKSQK
jgi:hypothetical protein